MHKVGWMVAGVLGMLLSWGLPVWAESPEIMPSDVARGGWLTGPVEEPPREARPVSWELGARLGYWSGDTLYRITFPLDFPYVEGESELVFPVDAVVGGVEAALIRQRRWALRALLVTNLTRDTGKMKDSDWITLGYGRTWNTGNAREKIVYSESDTEMGALLLDLHGTFYVLRRAAVALGIVGGYRYQRLDFEVSNVEQWCPLCRTLGTSDPYAVSVEGRVLTYEIAYDIPYGGVTVDLQASPRFALAFLGAYGRAYTEDVDDHLLRTKRSTAEAQGPFYLLQAVGQYAFSPRLKLHGAVSYTKVVADGTQKQVWYGATPGEPPQGTVITGIDYRAESQQSSVWIVLVYVF